MVKHAVCTVLCASFQYILDKLVLDEFFGEPFHFFFKKQNCINE